MMIWPNCSIFMHIKSDDDRAHIPSKALTPKHHRIALTAPCPIIVIIGGVGIVSGEQRLAVHTLIEWETWANKFYARIDGHKHRFLVIDRLGCESCDCTIFDTHRRSQVPDIYSRFIRWCGPYAARHRIAVARARLVVLIYIIKFNNKFIRRHRCNAADCWCLVPYHIPFATKSITTTHRFPSNDKRRHRVRRVVDVYWN